MLASPVMRIMVSRLDDSLKGVTQKDRCCRLQSFSLLCQKASGAASPYAHFKDIPAEVRGLPDKAPKFICSIDIYQ